MRCRGSAIALAFGVCLVGVGAQASTIFTETFATSTPGTYGLGQIPGTQFSVTKDNIDIVGVLNGSYFTCVYNPSGNCLDLIGTEGAGTITTPAMLDLTNGQQYTVQFGVAVQGVTATLKFEVAVGKHKMKLKATPKPKTLDVSFIAGPHDTGLALSFTTLTNVNNYNGPVLSDIVICTTNTTDTRPHCPKP